MNASLIDVGTVDGFGYSFTSAIGSGRNGDGLLSQRLVERFSFVIGVGGGMVTGGTNEGVKFDVMGADSTDGFAIGKVNGSVDATGAGG